MQWMMTMSLYKTSERSSTPCYFWGVLPGRNSPSNWGSYNEVSVKQQKDSWNGSRFVLMYEDPFNQSWTSGETKRVQLLSSELHVAVNLFLGDFMNRSHSQVSLITKFISTGRLRDYNAFYGLVLHPLFTSVIPWTRPVRELLLFQFFLLPSSVFFYKVFSHHSTHNPLIWSRNQQYNC